MAQIFFFDVPVYRLLEERYYEERARYIERQMYGTSPELHKVQSEFYERNPPRKIQIQDDLEKEFGGPWRFNEIIGFIRLYFHGRQVRGELWMVNRKRLVRTRHKLYLHQSHKVVDEEDVPYDASNEEIYLAIIRYLERARDELKGRVVDTETFRLIGRYVDWNGLRKAA